MPLLRPPFLRVVFLAAGVLAAAGSAAAALSVDLSSREQSRQFYRSVYAASEGVPMGFTGDVAAGQAGDTSAAFKEAVRLRVNFFRAFAGIAGEIVFAPEFNAKCQQAALVGSANNFISHFPPTSSRFYSAAAAEAAGKSNLALVESGPAAITGYIRDPGANNRDVGHRRWILYPQTREMGTGDVDVSPGFNAANALWILDRHAGTARPATRRPYIAWPPAGYVPHTLVFPRWSFSVAGADFSQAFIVVRRRGAAVPVAVDSLRNGFGENTIVWALDRQDPSAITSHPRPEADLTYSVEIGNVVVNGSAQTYRYDVIVYDPDVPTDGRHPVALAATSANAYSVAAPAYFSGLQWRTVRFAPASPRFDAEGSDPLGGLEAATGGYTPVVTDVRGAGDASYRLVHPAPVRLEQTLALPGVYYAPPDEAAALSFLSRLGYASARQLARVQISTDGGSAWSDVYTQAGTGTAGESTFAPRTVSLAAFAGRTFRVRFNFTFVNGGSLFTQTDPGVGWYFDDIVLQGVRSVATGNPVAIAGGAFALPAAAAAESGLQVRGLIATYPGEWTPVLPLASTLPTPPVTPPPSVTPPPVIGAVDPAPPTLLPGSRSARLVNLSVRTTAGTGADALVIGFNVAGTAPKPVLLRAVGPSLAAFGVDGALADPQLQLDAANGPVVARNDNWSGDAAIAAAAGRLGAFALPPASRDAAAYASVAPGSYTAAVTPASAAVVPGIALVELYDGDAGGPSRLANVSARTLVTPAAPLVVGFSVGGTGNANVLLRGVGPTLGSFGVEGTLADPKLEVFRDGSPLRTSDNWHPSLAPSFAAVGAFALQPGSRDAALVLSLPPGSYTATVSGVNDTSGAALVEVYELP